MNQPVSSDVSVPKQPTDSSLPTTVRWRVGTLAYTSAALGMVVLWLSLGNAGASFRDRIYPDSISLLLKKLGASNTALMVLTVVLTNAITMIFGPTISYKSDRYRSRFGRRIPFLLIATPVGALAMVGIAFTPQLGEASTAVLGVYSSLIALGVFSSIYHLAFITTSAVFGGLVNDVIPRPVLGRFFALLRIISLICGVVMNYVILKHVEAHFRLIFLSLAAVFAFTYIVMCLMVKEGDYPPPEKDAGDFRSGGFIAAIRVYVHECFSKSYYRWVFAALALSGLAVIPINSFSIYYAKSLNMPMGDYGTIKAINHTCGIFFAFPIGMLVDRFHALRVTMATMVLYCVTVLLGAILIRTPWSFGWAVFGHMVVSGFYLSASGALAQMLLPRLKFAQFLSASLVITSVATIVLSLGMGYLLDATGSNYRLTYIAGGVLAAAAVVVMYIVYRKFMAMGGPDGYVAPE